MTARKEKRRVEVLFILLVTELCIQCENDVKSWNGKSDLLIEINYMILHNFLHLFHIMQLKWFPTTLVVQYKKNSNRGTEGKLTTVETQGNSRDTNNKRGC